MKENKHINDLLNHLDKGDESMIENSFAEIFGDEQLAFSENFEDSVIIGTTKSDDENGWFQMIPGMFRWVLISGAAAAIILIAWGLIAEQSISVDAMSGLDQVSLSDYTALNSF